jgi:hypothetical protein
MHVACAGSSAFPTSTPKAVEIVLLKSLKSGTLREPSPPAVRGSLVQAKCEKGLSHEITTNCVFIAFNSHWRSEKAMTSAALSLTKSKGYHTITSHAPKNDVDPMLSKLPEGSSAVPVHSGAREATDVIFA